MEHQWMLKADTAMNSGTIGDGVSASVIEGIQEVDKASKIKNAAL